MRLNDHDYAIIKDALAIARDEYLKQAEHSAKDGWNRVTTDYLNQAYKASTLITKIAKRDA